MNVGMRNSMQRRSLAAIGLCACALGLAGCADAVFNPPPVNPESPVAAQAQAAVDKDYPYPSFRDIPAKPKDLPAPAQIKSEAVGLVQTRRGQEGWVAANPPMTSGGEAWAAQAMTQIPASVREAPPPDQAARSEALAAQLRAEAAAPPPIGGNPGPIVAPTPPAYLPAPPAKDAPNAAPAPAKGKTAKKKYKLPPPPASAPGKRSA